MALEVLLLPQQGEGCVCPPCCHTELGWKRTHLSVHLLAFGRRWKPTNSHSKPDGNPISVTKGKNLLCLLWILSKSYEGSCLLLSSGLKWATCTRNSVLEQDLIFMCCWYKCPPHLSRKSWLCHLVTPCYLRQRGSCGHMKEMITSTSFCCVWDVVIFLLLKSGFGTCFLQWNCCYIFPAQWSRMWSDVLSLWSINFQIIKSTVVFFSFLCAVFENKDKIVIIMEYASKGELYDYISERRRLSERETRHFFRQIVSAVHYCHKVSKGFHSKKCCFKACLRQQHSLLSIRAYDFISTTGDLH